MLFFKGPLDASTIFGGVLRNPFFIPTFQPRVLSTDKFGSNPGELRMLAYAPTRLPKDRPLIVVLHGCGQSAAGFAAGAGWLAMAQQYGVALVLPEQTYDNNQGRCFNWFRPQDVKRGSGEAMSIRQMIRTAVKRYGSDSKQIFVVGFSAGGGMAAALLAAYPNVFAAGGIVAGMPVGCAASPAGAMLRMRRPDKFRTRSGAANDVRAATSFRYRRAWPRLTIWQGTRDRTVDPENAEALAEQWSEVHGLSAKANIDECAPGFRRRAWGRANRPASVELWTIDDWGHRFPIGPGEPASSGALGGISAIERIAAFWGIGPSKSK
jgi:poly(hydroxyalkanoate) depolymerase family esterase